MEVRYYKTSNTLAKRMLRGKFIRFAIEGILLFLLCLILPSVIAFALFS